MHIFGDKLFVDQTKILEIYYWHPPDKPVQVYSSHQYL